MREILKTWKTSSNRVVTLGEAKKEFAWNEYKTQLAEEFAGQGKTLTFYTLGNFLDLCKGGHSENPAEEIDPKAFKLDKIAGAYWRGDSNNKQLIRIYGLAFKTKAELDEYLAMRAEAEKRDHKRPCPKLDLFTFSNLVGAGLPLWHPKGTLVRNLLDNFVWELRKARGYEQVDIPHITKKELYERSGHWDKFKDDLFRITTREGHEFAMKPMNCPHHTQIYARRQWSYRELPQRYASTTKVYRDEQSGELAGLSRVLAITQDDAHVFCRMDTGEGRIFENLGHRPGILWRIRIFAPGPAFTPRSRAHGKIPGRRQALGIRRKHPPRDCNFKKIGLVRRSRRSGVLRTEARLHGTRTPSAAFTRSPRFSST